jgi:hypothetical protein
MLLQILLVIYSIPTYISQQIRETQLTQITIIFLKFPLSLSIIIQYLQFVVIML